MKRGTAIFIAIIIAFLAIFSNLSVLPFDESKQENYDGSNKDTGIPIDDSDQDGMPDDWEIMFGLNPLDASDADLDMDIMPDEWDLFPGDGDGWDFDRTGLVGDEERFTNLEEYENGTDPIDWDTDGDGMPDGWEVHHGLDPGDPEDADLDLDDDGYDLDRSGTVDEDEHFTNLEEFWLNADPNSTDTDLDGMMDGWEAYYVLDPVDRSDAWEDPDQDGGYYWDQRDLKGFAFTNLLEYLADTHPFHNDTDGDGMMDGWEASYQYRSGNQINPLDPYDADRDIDDDELVNIDEYLNSFDVDGITHSDPTQADTDGDGLTDGDEIHGTFGYITDPTTNDTDRDDMPDGWEIHYNLNPTFYFDRYYDNDTDGYDFNYNDMVESWEEFPNYLEYRFGTDPWNNDTEGDTMTDGYEALQGLDPTIDDRLGDLDGDSWDGDGNGIIEGKEDLSNINEFNMDKRYPYKTLAGSNDSDGDGMPDGWEVYYELDPTNYRDADWDRDQDGFDVDRDYYITHKENFTNLEEYLNGTNPNATDTDNDTMEDGWEVYYDLDPLDPSDRELDPDGDGANNSLEFNNPPLESLDDGFTHTDPRDNDTDDDGLGDGNEMNGTYGGIFVFRSDPTNSDTDRDDMPDGWEIYYGYGWIWQDVPTFLNPTDWSDQYGNMDGDQLNNLEEYLNGTLPNNTDTDGDGMWDGWEVHYGLDPLRNDSYEDMDDDGLINLHEFANPTTNDSDGELQTDPTDPDSDDDGIWDGYEVHATLGYVTDPTNVDTDGDQLWDLEEYQFGDDGFITTPTLADTDGDDMPDGWESNYTLGWVGVDGNRYSLDPTDPGDRDQDYDNDGYDAPWMPQRYRRFSNYNEYAFQQYLRNEGDGQYKDILVNPFDPYSLMPYFYYTIGITTEDGFTAYVAEQIIEGGG